jgi:protein-L-isoaspartate O-methyltransferase
MLIPVGAMFWQDLMLIEKIDGKIRQQPILPVMFVPLIGKYGYKEYP